MSGKKQTTMAKLARERRVAEKRQLKLEKKLAKKQAALLGEAEPAPEAPEESEELEEPAT
jgi:hypothetical protein